MSRKPARDSILGKTTAAQNAQAGFPVPDGLPKLSKLEQTAWDQYIAAKSAWKQSELRSLHRLVKKETELADLSCEARLSPAVYEKGNGDFAPHPIHGMVDNCLKIIQSQLRTLGLNTPANLASKHDGVEPTAISQGRGKAKISLLK